MAKGYPKNRKRRKDYLKDQRLVKIHQLPENAHLLKSEDKEYCRRYSREYHKLHRLEHAEKYLKGTKYRPTAYDYTTTIPLKIKKGKVSVSFD